MVDVDLVEQLVNSIDEAVERLENALSTNNVDYANRLRVFIFNVYQEIDGILGGGA
jgi:hypothetical protein